MAGYARESVESKLAQTNQTMTGKVRRLVLSLLSTGHCSADQVASQLGIDRRTVHRRRAREGSRRRERPVSYVAELLGFSVHSAFARWFRGRFGCSASAWRAGRAQHAQAAQQPSPDGAPKLRGQAGRR